jgi:dihydroxyacetone kinase-like protein
MQRMINDPDQVVPDMLKGFIKAHGDLVEPTDNPRVLKYREAPVAGKVGIVTGGGSGHKPAFIGYIGKNLVDAVAVGEIFTSPTAAAFYQAFRAADAGEGVACLFGNYTGDIMNVKMAVEEAQGDDIVVKTVIANDDVPSAPKGEREKRRGVAGEVLLWKIGGAKAALGGGLDEVIAAAQKAIDNTRSIGIGLTPCTIPAVGKPNFSIEPGKMEVGIGHHGEPGIRVDDLVTADEMATMSLEVVLPEWSGRHPGDGIVYLLQQGGRDSGGQGDFGVPPLCGGLFHLPGDDGGHPDDDEAGRRVETARGSGVLLHGFEAELEESECSLPIEKGGLSLRN